MADITRNIGQVEPANFIKPGVQKPSPLSLAAQLGEQGLELDKQLARARLSEDLENLHTQYETSAPGAVAVQNELAPEDKRQVDDINNKLASNKSAVDQGVMTYDQYRLRGERLLRQAISKRPGLAQEFRQVAAQHLGVDVVGASVDVLASWEHKMEAAVASAADKAASAAADEKKRMATIAREHLALVGVDSATLTDDQVMGTYSQHQGAITEALRQQATASVLQTAATSLDNQNKLNRPRATAEFISQVTNDKLEVVKGFNMLYGAMRAGHIKPGDMAQQITMGMADISGRIDRLRMAAARGDVDPDAAEKAITSMTELGNMLSDLSKGNYTNEILKNKVEGVNLWVTQNMMDNDPNVAVMAAATKVFGPEVMNTFVQPGGSFNKTAAITLGNMLNSTGAPTENARNAGSVASSVISSVLDRGGAASNPEQVPQMAKVLTNAGAAFAGMPQKDFKAEYLTGPNGYLTVMHAHREALGKSLPADQKDDVLMSVSVAALTNYHALAASIWQKLPMLRDKLDFHLDPKTGEMVRPKAGVSLSAAEKQALLQYNQAFSGRRVIQTIQAVGDMDPESAKNFFYSGEFEYQKAKKESAKKPAAKAGGDQWWLNF